MAATVEELQILVTASVDKALKNLKKVDKSNDTTTKSFLNMAKKIAGPAAAGLIIAKAIQIGAEFSKLAAEAEEVESKFGVVFGNTAKDVQSWADTYSDAIGRSETDTLGFLGSIGDLLKPLGFSKEAVDGLSQQVVMLANDLGSFNDMPTADVMRDIQGAMTGSFEVTKKYGVVLNEAVIKQEAMNKGLYDGKGAVDAQVKAQIALELIMKGTSDAQGDLLRTQDSATNVSIRLAAAQKDLGIVIGKSINEGLTPLKSVTADIIKKYAEWLEKTGKVKDAMDSITDGNIDQVQSIETLEGAIEGYDKKITQSAANYQNAMARSGSMSLEAQKIASDLQAAKIASIEADKQAAIEQLNSMRAIDKYKALQASLSVKYSDELAAQKAKELADAKILADQAADTATRKTIEAKLLKEFVTIQEQVNGKLLEGNGDLEKEQALRKALNSLIDEGFTAQGNGFKNITAAAEKYGVVLTEATEDEVEEYKKSWLTKEEIAAQSIGSIDDWLIKYHADEKNRLAKEVQDFKNAWNDKLSIASDFTSGFENLFSQLSENEIQNITNTEDKRIAELTKSYDYQLSLLEEGSAEYEAKEKEKTAALKRAETDKLAALKSAKEKQWKIDKAFAVGKAIIDTISSVVEAAPNPWLMAAMGIMGAAQVAAIAAQPMPAFAKGGDFVTDGPTQIMVGDNPGGRERVTVEPLSSPNINGPQSGMQPIQIFLGNELIFDSVNDGITDGKIIIEQSKIVA